MAARRSNCGRTRTRFIVTGMTRRRACEIAGYEVDHAKWIKQERHDVQHDVVDPVIKIEDRAGGRQRALQCEEYDAGDATPAATPADVDGGSRRQRCGCSPMRESQSARPERHWRVAALLRRVMQRSGASSPAEPRRRARRHRRRHQFVAPETTTARLRGG
eukprot:6212302-Pleurochrysis_carterae.AAC.2